jgi:pimeloyl-ACP methyl ester carboxylesterase
LLDYPRLLDWLESRIPRDRPVILLGESFSGPIALEYASRHPERVSGVILCASFILPPVARVIGLLIRKEFFRLPIPAIVLRRYLVGKNGDIAAAKKAVKEVSPAVLANRIKTVFNVDAREALRNCQAPILYLLAEDDRIVRPRSLAAIREIRPDMQTVIVRGPHLLLQSCPREAWLAIEGFLGGI